MSLRVCSMCVCCSVPKLCVLEDSDEESSSAGSTDEEEVPLTEPQWNLGEKGSPVGSEG